MKKRKPTTHTSLKTAVSKVQSKNKTDSNSHSAAIDKNELCDTFIQLLEGNPSVQGLANLFSPFVTENEKSKQSVGDDDNLASEKSYAATDMSDDSDIEDRRTMSSAKGKRSMPVGNQKGAKRRRQETVSKKTDKAVKSNAKPYDCQLCETSFSGVSARNGHYVGKHKVHDEKLLFFPNGTGLVESSLEHQISLKPDWFKAAVRSKRRTTVCKLCVVDLDTDGHLNLHYKDVHKVTRMNVLSELIRLKNTDIKKVAVTHKCDFCTVPFDSAQELETHMKSDHDADFKRCDYCNIRVQIDAYNVHIQKKHADMIEKRVERRIAEVPVLPVRKSKLAKRKKKIVKEKIETPKRDVESKSKVRKTKDHKVLEMRSSFGSATKKTALALYLCKACKLATASYDNAVAHAQDHILNLHTPTNHCDICKLNFAADFEKHRKLHSIDDDLDAESFRLFPYDYRLLMSHKWYDMFVNCTKAMANKVRSASIYFASRCIRLKLENDSKDATERFTLFMCVTCNKYVDSPSIELHVRQEGDCSNQLSCYLCYQCQRQFFTQKARDQHSLTHEALDADKRYRTVLFNDQKDLICNKKLLQAGMNIVLTNEESVDEHVSANMSISNASGIITVANEGLSNVSNELYATVTDNEVVADIYECNCGLSFDRIEFLFNHWKICSPSLKLVTKTCNCGLVFDNENYDYHCKVHSNGFTTFSVKEVSIRVKKSIDVRHINVEFRNTTEMNTSEIIYNGMEGNVLREEDVNKERQETSLQSLQVGNIVNFEHVTGNTMPDVMPVDMEYQQCSNEHDSAKYIGKTHDDSKTVYNELEAHKELVSKHIKHSVSQNELQNQVAEVATGVSISIQNDGVVKESVLCCNNGDENRPVVDRIGLDFKQVTDNDKNLLINNTKEQEKDEVVDLEKKSINVMSSLVDNKLIDIAMEEIPKNKEQDKNENSQPEMNSPIVNSLLDDNELDISMKEIPHNNKEPEKEENSQSETNSSIVNSLIDDNEFDISMKEIPHNKEQGNDKKYQSENNSPILNSSLDNNVFDIALKETPYNTKEQEKDENFQSENNSTVVNSSLNANEFIEIPMKEIPHNNAENQDEVINDIDKIPATIESNKSDEGKVNTQELWAKEAEIEFTDTQNEKAETQDDNKKSNDELTDIQNQNYNGIEIPCEDSNSNQEDATIFSEEELLKGDVGLYGDDSLLTDDEDP